MVERWCGSSRVVGDNELTSIVVIVLVKPIVTTRHPLHGCGFVTGHDLVTRTRTRDLSRGLSRGLSQPVPFPSRHVHVVDPWLMWCHSHVGMCAGGLLLVGKVVRSGRGEGQVQHGGGKECQGGGSCC